MHTLTSTHMQAYLHQEKKKKKKKKKESRLVMQCVLGISRTVKTSVSDGIYRVF